MAQLRFLGFLLAALPRTILGRLRRGPLRPGWTLVQEAVVAALRANGLYAMSLPASIARRHTAALAQPVRRGIRIQDLQLGSVRARVFTAEGTGSTCILWFQGGGYAMGAIETYGRTLGALAQRARARVIAVGYRQAPEHPFPAAFEDVQVAYSELLRTGVSASQVVLGGDSAGGALALALAVQLRQTGGPQPRGVAVVSPWVDLTSSSHSVEANAPYDWGDRAYLTYWSSMYLHGADPRDWRASPLYADLKGLPPVQLHVGSAELLHDEVLQFATRAREQGVSVDLRDWPELPHGWILLDQMFPQAGQTLEAIAQFVNGLA